MSEPSRPSDSANLHQAIIDNDLSSLRDAIEAEPGLLYQSTDSGLPLLYTAALYRNQAAIDWLLNQGAEVDIFASAYLGRVSEAESLLQKDHDLVFAVTPNGMTALHYAAQAGHTEVAELIIRHQSNVNAADQQGNTPLAYATHRGPWKSKPAEDIIQLLIESGAEVDWFQAAALGQTQRIAELLSEDRGLLNTTDAQNRTALLHGVRNNQLAVVKLLVDQGADLGQSDPIGIAALHRTSQECSDELIQFLIDRGAKAHLACYVACGDEEGTEAAIARNPQAIHETFYEHNPVGYAIHSWQPGTLRILLTHGACLTQEDQQAILRISNGDHALLSDLMKVKVSETATKRQHDS
ncbi:ankyrin repeat domain-containing protein [Bremerella sp. JC817]|uniref:ankyrin repeat domain-containing protein n=1 Tax=Bremerella sp. JC817 TaxID=3231756 RepID=UPI00345A5F88